MRNLLTMIGEGLSQLHTLNIFVITCCIFDLTLTDGIDTDNCFIKPEILS